MCENLFLCVQTGEALRCAEYVKLGRPVTRDLNGGG